MKTSCRPHWTRTRALKSVVTIFIFSGSLLAEPIPLKRIVELALSHATAGNIASADEQRIDAAQRELSASYIPQITTAAGLGYSYGFPLALEGSAPSLFNISAQSSLLNASLHSAIQAAKADSKMATLNTKDQRDAVIQDVAQSYAELAKWEHRLTLLQESATDANKFEAAVTERVQEGVDSEVDATKARLSTARVRFRVTEAQGAADVLREHLSKLTGLPAASIQTDPESFHTPSLPTEETATDTAASTPGVQAAMEHARAQYLRAQGEHRAFWPTVDFAAQYALLSKFNNYQNYYIPSRPCPSSVGEILCVTNAFQQNNATFGVNIRFSIFNASQKAREQLADADALKAKKQAESVHDKVSEDTLRLRRSVAQLQAARDVAQLEYELADKTLAATQTRIDAGTANLHDLEDTRMQLNERSMALQDVTFDLQRAQLGLMRTTGDLEKWALGSQK
ncbi:MAG TPA: TolC family protein [Candidatus Sulfotelmatobacter sp.]|nr:TolC family protein [Candidatus Sulfotelmatobacter sp.]